MGAGNAKPGKQTQRGRLWQKGKRAYIVGQHVKTHENRTPH